MTAYYPSQGSHYSHQAPPAVYTSSSHGHGHGYYPTQHSSGGEYYGQPANGVVYVPSHSNHRSLSRHKHHHKHHHHHRHHAPQVPVTAPVMVQPSAQYGGGYGAHHHHGGHYRIPFGERVRRFFGLAPRGPFKYRSNRGSWGFLGWSRRARYADAATGVEVDRKGRPVYRI